MLQGSDIKSVESVAGDTLRKMARRLDSPHRWTTAALARNDFGDPVTPTNPSAKRWDVSGALVLETCELPSDLRLAVRSTIKRWLLTDECTTPIIMQNKRPGNDDLCVVNDELTFAQVHRWLEGARKLAASFE